MSHKNNAAGNSSGNNGGNGQYTEAMEKDLLTFFLEACGNFHEKFKVKTSPLALNSKLKQLLMQRRVEEKRNKHKHRHCSSSMNNTSKKHRRKNMATVAVRL
jgi:hypothetical protein